MDIDNSMRSYATVRQLEYIEAIDKHGSYRAAAKALGKADTTIKRAIDALKVRVARLGNAPGHFNHGVAPGYLMGKVTVQRAADGQVERTWERQSPDQTMERLNVAFDAMCEELPRVAPQPAPSSAFFDSLCNVYTLTDSHVGMLAWGKETGEPWDLKIAEATLTQCFEHMVSNSPPARVALVNQLGDFLHYDGLLPLTPTSGHVLDSDGRAGKMVDAAIRILRHVIAFALARHDRVVVLMAEGNHDPMGSVWLRKMFKALYENEPRVHVIDSELPYYVHQHGKTMLAFHHGHLTKNDNLPLLFAAQFPKTWGATTKRYAHSGHRHHVEDKEHSGMRVHQHTTLAARDAYAARGGWISERHVTSITYHAEFGEVARNTVTPEMLTA